MFIFLFSLCLFIFPGIAILSAKSIFDNPSNDPETKIYLVINPDYINFLLYPLAILFACGCIYGPLSGYAWGSMAAGLLAVLLELLYTLFIVGTQIKKYYFTDSGITILNIVTNKYLDIPLATIKGYSFHRGSSGEHSYFIISTVKNLVIVMKRIKDPDAFKKYFADNQKQYYEYDWVTGNDYPK